MVSWARIVLAFGCAAIVGCGAGRLPNEVFDFCGDSSIAVFEECDDGNRANGDGCSRFCEIEEGYLCRGQPSFCNKSCEPNCDEDSPPSDETSTPATCNADPDQLGDGWCNTNNNHAACFFDGGDCCESTCVDAEFPCDMNNFTCLDSGACENNPEGCEECAPGCSMGLVGNGSCNPECYNSACGFDGQPNSGMSDCACIEVGLFESCNSTCVGEEAVSTVGNGICENPETNVFNCEEWNFDGGDCVSSNSPGPDGTYSDCTGYVEYIGDGWCDNYNNSLSCGWDGGDCCESTCNDGVYLCGYVGFDCLDPSAEENDSNLENTCDGAIDEIDNGVCNSENNNGGCGWDGGDCCLSTNGNCGNELLAPCECLDPNALESTQDDPFSACDGNVNWIGDGWCDGINNNGGCFFDGGDCCESTCQNAGYLCGTNSTFNCLDPGAFENGGDFSECPGDMDDSGDGQCDPDNNNALCDWDRGDCCAVTNPLCADNGDFPCDCQDPLGNNPTSCNALPIELGDGACDSFNNTEECDWDGGDCCSSTNLNCETLQSPGGCLCLDPEATENSVPSLHPCTGNFVWMGDGWCDPTNNNIVCEWDGGDCCESTCFDGLYACGAYTSFSCLDPLATENQPDYSDCEGDMDSAADGYCDVDNNSYRCGWDLGDCCENTCQSDVYLCGSGGYQCQDPTALNDQVSCTAGEIIDCVGLCVPQTYLNWLGDGFCDQGTVNLNCEVYEFDGGDCAN